MSWLEDTPFMKYAKYHFNHKPFDLTCLRFELKALQNSKYRFFSGWSTSPLSPLLRQPYSCQSIGPTVPPCLGCNVAPVDSDKIIAVRLAQVVVFVTKFQYGRAL